MDETPFELLQRKKIQFKKPETVPTYRLTRVKMARKQKSVFPAPRIIRLVPSKFRPILGKHIWDKPTPMPMLVDPHKMRKTPFKIRPKQVDPLEKSFTCNPPDSIVSLDDVRSTMLSHFEDWHEWHLEGAEEEDHSQDEASQQTEGGVEEQTYEVEVAADTLYDGMPNAEVVPDNSDENVIAPQ